jgi:hypothetical protein
MKSDADDSTSCLTTGVLKFVLGLSGVIITALLIMTWASWVRWADSVDEQNKSNTARITEIEANYRTIVQKLDNSNIRQSEILELMKASTSKR